MDTKTFSQAGLSRWCYHNIFCCPLSCIYSFVNAKFEILISVVKFENDDESAFCIFLLVDGNVCGFFLLYLSLYSRKFMET